MQSEADVKRDTDIGVDRPGSAETVDPGREKFQFYSGLKNCRSYLAGMKNHLENLEDLHSIDELLLACQSRLSS